MAKVSMEVVGQPFRGVAVGDVARVSLKDSRKFADNLKPLDAPNPIVKKAARKAPAKKAAKKTPAKKATYRTRALKAR